jgi:hypothetical protein
MKIKFSITTHPIDFDLLKELGLLKRTIVQPNEVGKISKKLVESGYNKIISHIDEWGGDTTIKYHFQKIKS